MLGTMDTKVLLVFCVDLKVKLFSNVRYQFNLLARSFTFKF